MELEILRIDGEKRSNLKDVVTEEIPFTIYLGQRELLTLLCSPFDLKELSIGFLFSAGLIESKKDIENIVIDRERWAAYVTLKNKNNDAELTFRRLYTSGCGRGVYFYNSRELLHRRAITRDCKISAVKILELVNSFEKRSVTFKKTGGVHSAALSDSEGISIFMEDIGRHNALDKVIGGALVKELNMEDLLVITSGRISSEIVSKVEKMGAAFLISRSAPTNQAVNLAKELNLTLVGFVRGKRMNVYTARERVV